MEVRLPCWSDWRYDWCYHPPEVQVVCVCSALKCDTSSQRWLSQLSWWTTYSGLLTRIRFSNTIDCNVALWSAPCWGILCQGSEGVGVSGEWASQISFTRVLWLLDDDKLQVRFERLFSLCDWDRNTGVVNCCLDLGWCGSYMSVSHHSLEVYVKQRRLMTHTHVRGDDRGVQR